MPKKLLFSLLAIVASIATIFGSQWLQTGSPPNVATFLSQTTCQTDGSTVTITATTGEQMVVTFPQLTAGTNAKEILPNNLLYYPAPKKGDRGVTPLSLLNEIAKYRNVVEIARNCLLSTLTNV